MGDTDRMDLSEVNVSPTRAPAQVAPQEDRLTRLERMLESLLEERHWQQESFAAGGLAKTLHGNNPLSSRRTDAELEREQRRKSIIVNQVRDKQATSTVSSMTTVAMPTRFESKALMNTVTYS